MGVGYRNSEGYWDPVPFAATANVEREAKKSVRWFISVRRTGEIRNEMRRRRGGTAGLPWIRE